MMIVEEAGRHAEAQAIACNRSPHYCWAWTISGDLFVIYSEIFHGKLENTTKFGDFFHECWVYRPANYQDIPHLPFMLFLDGGNFVSPTGPWRTATVLDVMIADRSLSPMGAMFVDPGALDQADAVSILSNRSVEYDSLGSDFAEFIEQDLLPVARRILPLPDDPDGSGIGGHSSGGICMHRKKNQHLNSSGRAKSRNQGSRRRHLARLLPHLRSRI